MRQLLKAIGVVLLAASMTACINVSTVVKVNPDGSGFIEETVLISRVVLEQFSGMMQGMAGHTFCFQSQLFEILVRERTICKSPHFLPAHLRISRTPCLR